MSRVRVQWGMPTSIVITPELALASTLSLVALGGGGATWVIKRWIDKVEKKLDTLSTLTSDLKLKGALSDERFSGLLGSIDTQLKISQSQTKDVGRITASVDKLWAVLAAKGLLDPRLSDGCNGDAGKG